MRSVHGCHKRGSLVDLLSLCLSPHPQDQRTGYRILNKERCLVELLTSRLNRLVLVRVCGKLNFHVSILVVPNNYHSQKPFSMGIKRLVAMRKLSHSAASKLITESHLSAQPILSLQFALFLPFFQYFYENQCNLNHVLTQDNANLGYLVITKIRKKPLIRSKFYQNHPIFTQFSPHRPTFIHCIIYPMPPKPSPTSEQISIKPNICNF